MREEKGERREERYKHISFLLSPLSFLLSLERPKIIILPYLFLQVFVDLV